MLGPVNCRSDPPLPQAAASPGWAVPRKRMAPLRQSFPPHQDLAQDRIQTRKEGL